MLDGSIVPFYLRIDKQISHHEYDPVLASKKLPDSQRLSLHTRSWALQERILVTRIVHFTGQELVWECRTSSSCECRHLENLPHSLLPIKQHWTQRLSRSRELGHRWYDVWRFWYDYTDLLISRSHQTVFQRSLGSPRSSKPREQATTLQVCGQKTYSRISCG